MSSCSTLIPSYTLHCLCRNLVNTILRSYKLLIHIECALVRLAVLPISIYNGSTCPTVLTTIECRVLEHVGQICTCNNALLARQIKLCLQLTHILINLGVIKRETSANQILERSTIAAIIQQCLQSISSIAALGQEVLDFIIQSLQLSILGCTSVHNSYCLLNLSLQCQDFFLRSICCHVHTFLCKLVHGIYISLISLSCFSSTLCIRSYILHIEKIHHLCISTIIIYLELINEQPVGCSILKLETEVYVLAFLHLEHEFKLLRSTWICSNNLRIFLRVGVSEESYTLYLITSALLLLASHGIARNLVSTCRQVG